MPFKIVRNDITKMEVDAIVNAANPELKMGGGVCGAIFAAAGPEELQRECDRIGGCEVGQAVITGAGRLSAKYIIHTVGPIWRGGGNGEAKLLRGSYMNSLELAAEHKCKSIAFPLISSGIYGYPKDQALHIAVSAIGEFLMKNDMDVYLVVFDRSSYKLSEKLFSAIGKYIDDNYVDARLDAERSRRLTRIEEQMMRGSDGYPAASGPADQASFGPVDQAARRLADQAEYGPAKEEEIHLLRAAARPVSPRQKQKRRLEDIVGQLDETFSEMLLRLIDEKGMTDVETYKRANIDRRLFSKIRSNKEYKPSKPTAIALAIALRLNLDETLDLLAKAGYTLSMSSKFDVIIRYFIEEGNYNIFEINEALFAFEQDLLGA
ncbi:MAG TPA: macro domain-containing protein [Clostridia bacterium]|nr:macro domain-containing protein [Clostridiales bacterium]HOL92113.1 macro domain-containing protein [Clostridiales bacterium]